MSESTRTSSSFADTLPTFNVRPDLFPTGLTILKAIVVARWLALAWMFSIVAFISADDLRHPVAAWAAVGATLALAAVSTAFVRSDASRLLRASFVAAEVGLALALSIVDGYVFEPGHVFATSQSIATQWPLLAMATTGVAFGPIVAGIVGILVGPAEWLGAVFNDFPRFGTEHVVSFVATSLFFAACGVVFGLNARLLKRAETEIADRRARDEVGRMMHDTVLQTLALVERRSAGSDPQLAAAAREADRDLRDYLFGAAGRSTFDLETRIRQIAERARRGHDTAITVSVIDDGCRLTDEQQELFARALGEAVTNALKHAQAKRIVVFAETDDRGQVFASVRDDGRGFDTSITPSSHGLNESVRARIESIGGCATIVSTTDGAGTGTEICLWSSTRMTGSPS